jgi:hypothetical protein
MKVLLTALKEAAPDLFSHPEKESVANDYA